MIKFLTTISIFLLASLFSGCSQVLQTVDLQIDTIDESESLRDSEVFISSKFKNVVNKSNLPWPKFFIGDVLSDNINLIDYFYTAKLIMCKVSKNNEEIVVSYDKNNFKYIDNKLYLTIN